MVQAHNFNDGKRGLRMLETLTKRRSDQHKALFSYADTALFSDDEAEDVTAP